jgi:uncharacterized membrane protein YedE/YeeE
MRPAAWRPYITGALAGLVAVLSVWISTEVLEKPKYLGTSTTYVRTAGLIQEQITPGCSTSNAYYEATGIKVDWQMLLVAGILVGALAASLADRSFKFEKVPPIWLERFGPSVARRGVLAFLGGVVALFGVRLAGGCPSGHGMSGLMQLSVSGFLAMAGFFGGGVLTANLLYRTRGGA